MARQPRNETHKRQARLARLRNVDLVNSPLAEVEPDRLLFDYQKEAPTDTRGTTYAREISFTKDGGEIRAHRKYPKIYTNEALLDIDAEAIAILQPGTATANARAKTQDAVAKKADLNIDTQQNRALHEEYCNNRVLAALIGEDRVAETYMTVSTFAPQTTEAPAKYPDKVGQFKLMPATVLPPKPRDAAPADPNREIIGYKYNENSPEFLVQLKKDLIVNGLIGNFDTSDANYTVFTDQSTTTPVKKIRWFDVSDLSFENNAGNLSFLNLFIPGDTDGVPSAAIGINEQNLARIGHNITVQDFIQCYDDIKDHKNEAYRRILAYGEGKKAIDFLARFREMELLADFLRTKPNLQDKEMTQIAVAFLYALYPDQKLLADDQDVVGGDAMQRFITDVKGDTYNQELTELRANNTLFYEFSDFARTKLTTIPDPAEYGLGTNADNTIAQAIYEESRQKFQQDLALKTDKAHALQAANEIAATLTQTRQLGPINGKTFSHNEKTYFLALNPASTGPNANKVYNVFEIDAANKCHPIVDYQRFNQSALGFLQQNNQRQEEYAKRLAEHLLRYRNAERTEVPISGNLKYIITRDQGQIKIQQQVTIAGGAAPSAPEDINDYSQFITATDEILQNFNHAFELANNILAQQYYLAPIANSQDRNIALFNGNVIQNYRFVINNGQVERINFCQPDKTILNPISSLEEIKNFIQQAQQFIYGHRLAEFLVTDRKDLLQASDGSALNNKQSLIFNANENRYRISYDEDNHNKIIGVSLLGENNTANWPNYNKFNELAQHAIEAPVRARNEATAKQIAERLLATHTIDDNTSQPHNNSTEAVIHLDSGIWYKITRDAARNVQSIALHKATNNTYTAINTEAEFETFIERSNRLIIAYDAAQRFVNSEDVAKERDLNNRIDLIQINENSQYSIHYSKTRQVQYVMERRNNNPREWLLNQTGPGSYESFTQLVNKKLAEATQPKNFILNTVPEKLQMLRSRDLPNDVEALHHYTPANSPTSQDKFSFSTSKQETKDILRTGNARESFNDLLAQKLRQAMQETRLDQKYLPQLIVIAIKNDGFSSNKLEQHESRRNKLRADLQTLNPELQDGALTQLVDAALRFSEKFQHLCKNDKLYTGNLNAENFVGMRLKRINIDKAQDIVNKALNRPNTDHVQTIENIYNTLNVNIETLRQKPAPSPRKASSRILREHSTDAGFSRGDHGRRRVLDLYYDNRFKEEL